jgi:hypothetical protein
MKGISNRKAFHPTWTNEKDFYARGGGVGECNKTLLLWFQQEFLHHGIICEKRKSETKKKQQKLLL